MQRGAGLEAAACVHKVDCGPTGGSCVGKCWDLHGVRANSQAGKIALVCWLAVLRARFQCKMLQESWSTCGRMSR